MCYNKVMVKVECKKIRIAALFAVAFLSILSLSNVAHAANNSDADYKVIVETMLTLDISANSVTLNLNPASKPFDYGDLDVTVTTNNSTGYKLSVTGASTDLEEENDARLKIPTLDALSGGYTDSTFTANRWGYGIAGSGIYGPFVSGAEIVNKTGPVNNDVTTLRFAAKINGTQAAGSYSDTLTFTAVANPLPPKLQNITASDCPTDPTSIVDARDGQTYTIKQMPDGRCWMLENLNLGATEITKDLTSANTNLSTTIPAATFNSWRATGTSFTRTYEQGQVIPITTANSSNHLAADSSSGAKYGTLYNYCAATAGTSCVGASLNTTSTGYDLCPKGWRLPMAGAASDANNEFQALYVSLGSKAANMIKSISDGGASLALSGMSTTNLSSQGSMGNYWSSTLKDNQFMYVPIIGSSYFMSSNYNARDTGFSIRCILKN